jgi:hypothetical protein
VISDHAVPVLPKGVFLTEHGLVDEVRGETIPINHTARAVLILIDGRASLREIVRTLTIEYGVNDDAVLAEVKQLFIRLNSHYLMNFRRWTTPVLFYVQWLLSVLRMYPRPVALKCRVDHGSITSIQDLVKAAALMWVWPLGVALLSFPALATISGLPTAASAWASGMVVSAFLATLLHEYGHALASDRITSTQAFYGITPLGISVFRGSTVLSHERMIGLAGPILAATVGLMVVGLGVLIKASTFQVLAWPFLAQLGSLIPGSRDVAPWFKFSVNGRTGGFSIRRLISAGGVFFKSFAILYAAFLAGAIFLTIIADINQSDSFSIGRAWFEVYSFTREGEGHTGSTGPGVLVLATVLSGIAAAVKWRRATSTDSRGT